MEKIQQTTFNGVLIEVGKPFVGIVGGVAGPLLISDEVVGILVGGAGAVFLYTLLGRVVRLYDRTGEADSQTLERRRR